MPAITVSSVNTTTEEITAVAHGLLTGDRFRLRNVGGALPAATPSLAGATDYYAVRTGADTLKIAASSSDALAGTPVVINLSGSGSGTTTVEYGLPYCIPTALAAAGTQIKSANDNAAWSSLVALYAVLTGQAQAVWSAVTIAVSVALTAGLRLVSSSGKAVTHQAPAGLAADYSVTWPGAVPATKGYISIDSSGQVSTSAPMQFSALLGIPTSGAGTISGGIALNTSTGENQLPCSVMTGGTITAWSVSILKQSTTGTVSAFLRKVAANGSATQVGATQSNSANNPGAITLGTSVSQAVAAGEQYIIIVTGGGNAGDSIGAYSLTS